MASSRETRRLGRGQSVAATLLEPLLASPVASAFVRGRHATACVMLRSHEQPYGKKMGETISCADLRREMAEVVSKIEEGSGG